MPPPVSVDTYQERLSDILKNHLLPDKAVNDPGMKVIHDPLWGSRLFYPWEIALIDTPLCQRLRQIHQLGSAFLTYPSAIHNRFSHSLGVTVLAGRLITRLKEKVEIIRDNKIEVSKKDIYTVRMTGLLHDVGHCFFSHLGENVLKPLMETVNAQIARNLKISKPKTHEFISYLILTNDYFLKYWEKRIRPLFRDVRDCPNPKEMAKMIIKKPPSKKKRYLQEIISGPFDVDKLEYLYRDARTAGLEISYDIERYFYKIMLILDKKGNSRLVIGHGGVSAIEQLIFSKMMLFSFVYHHQKVLASDSLLSDLILEIIENPENNERFKIDHPLDLLLYTDYDVLSNNTMGTSERFSLLREKIAKRDLPKRCFVLNKEYVENLSGNDLKLDQWDRLLDDLRDIHKEGKRIRNEIVERMNNNTELENVSLDDIHFVYPKPPKMKEAAHAPVLGPDNSLCSMDEYFKIEGWETTYDLKKLKGYFYANEEIKDIAAKVIEKYLKDEYGLEFNQKSKIEAKIQ